jgi:nitrogen fixation NifU-like protein
MSDIQEQNWKETIIDHGQFPRRHGPIESASHQGKGENPFCGDRVSLQLAVENGVISDIGFEATGCAISLSSASLLAANLAGKSTSEAQVLFESVHGLLIGNKPSIDLGELEALALVTRYPARVKCASLVWHVLKNALADDKETASTE